MGKWLTFAGAAVLAMVTVRAAAQEGGAQAGGGDPDPVVHLGAVERVSFYPRGRKVVVAGEVQLRRRQAIELIACARGGKTHESILLLKCRPSDLNAGLILLGCKFESGPRAFQDATKPVGTRVVVEVEWTFEGTPHRYRVEELTWDARYGRPMPKIAWVYVGSKFGVDPVTGEEVFVADRERNLITTLHDPFGLLDNPLPSGGDVTPGRYVSNPDRMPPPGTAVTVTIRRATDAEIAASIEVETQAEKDDAAYRAEQEQRMREGAKEGGKEGDGR